MQHQWVYSSGSNWAVLDQATTQVVDKMWGSAESGWVHSPTFGNQPITSNQVNSHQFKPMASGWFYKNGAKWLPLETDLQERIEELWKSESDAWVESRAFGRVYINTQKLIMSTSETTWELLRDL
ncbi:hypothetical protein PHYBLDRAFT_152833 [Phycomyces blakesleeanus NRRL 1555(-)]|uniref:WWE domain-containing protein n=1 Tax=Phycomyces blakesleeanus (strain ATCC 8743b / DSM 1359 / FGSC 10004 / NBRC 33097 / NRRL 1555) TaxID=763407 RepID=A0A167JI69_PHYB8|nr:hypothetical protein PHYBLDRAFT_152833 [Phycomyces blakesleeanus NRRL 1555(-)]OAD66026.1 hypothetical protein PHYBLDRAFT_152833 [Phycomyces blakesleeanus NRRL 1555(-)]|eukprot:XP_018284066.1 hypothetical protein PHYBLDRAFT_152833 [Phycomyces blakesleeanus NRRL 1555(-)]